MGYTEVSGYNTGLSQVRYLDAFAMRTWASKGFRRVGYEIKVARSDWLQELKDPWKHLQGYYLAHEFWYALAEGVYDPKKDDISSIEGCGILEIFPNGDRKIRRSCYRHEAWPMPETFIASLLLAAMRSSTQYAEEYARLDAEQVWQANHAQTNTSPFQQLSLLDHAREEMNT
jgi:hypothetical protein